MRFEKFLSATVFVGILSLGGVDVTAQSWQLTPLLEGDWPDHAYTLQGELVVSWVQEGSMGPLKVARYTSDNSVTIDELVAGNFAGPPSLILDSNGFGIVGLHNHTFEGLNIFQESASGWETQFVESSGHDGWNPSLALNATGGLFAASLDDSGGLLSSVEFASRTSSGWTVEPVRPGVVRKGTPSALVLASNGDPTVAVYDPIESRLGVYSRTGSTWSMSFEDLDGNAGQGVSMYSDALGDLHLSYVAIPSSGASVVRYASRVAGVWSTEDVTEIDPGGIGLGRRITGLLKADDGTILIAVADSFQVRMASKSLASNWQTEIVAESSSPDHHFNYDLSFQWDGVDQMGGKGNATIVFHETDESNSGRGTIWLASPMLSTAISNEVSIPKSTFDVFPNPAHGSVTVKFEGLRGGIPRLDVFDLLGRKVYELRSNSVDMSRSQLLDVSGWDSGLYMIRAEYTDGSSQVNSVAVVR